MLTFVEVYPGRWAYMVDGKFPDHLYDPVWGLTTWSSKEEAQCAIEAR